MRLQKGRKKQTGRQRLRSIGTTGRQNLLTAQTPISAKGVPFFRWFSGLPPCPSQNIHFSRFKRTFQRSGRDLQKIGGRISHGSENGWGAVSRQAVAQQSGTPPTTGEGSTGGTGGPRSGRSEGDLEAGPITLGCGRVEQAP